MKTKFIFILFIIVIVSTNAQEKKENFYEIAFKTQKSLSRIAENTFNKNNKSEIINSFQIMEKAHQVLFKILEDCNERKPISDNYLKTLKSSQNALEIISKGTFSKEIEIEIFEMVTQDYLAKTKSINYGIQPSIIDEYKLTVKTKGKKGYSVFVKYSFDFDKDIIRYSFNNKTNNANRLLPPGYYIVWIEKGDYKSRGKLIEVVSTDLSNNIIYFEI